MSEEVSRPKHYTSTKIEPIEVINDWDLGFNLGNVIKYVARHKLKGAPLLDLKKAQQYLQFEINKHDNTIQEPKIMGKSCINSNSSNRGVLFDANVLRDCKGGILCQFCSPTSCVGGCTVTIANS